MLWQAWKNWRNWLLVLITCLVLWISCSLVLDLVVIPSMAAGGMMQQFGFSSTAYMVFGLLNRWELLCAALVLTGVLVIQQARRVNRRSLLLAVWLLLIPVIYTYMLSPSMAAWGMTLDLFSPVVAVPTPMLEMQYGYLILELSKIMAAVVVLGDCLRLRRTVTAD